MPQEMILPHTLQRADYIGPAALFTKFRTLEVSCTTHSHDFFEIEWITGGSGLHLLNGVPHPLRPGSLYLLTPEDVHAVRPTPRLEYYNIMFSEDFFAPDFAYEALLSCRGVQTELDDAAHARMAPLFEQLVAEAAHASERYAISYMRSLMQCILITLLRRMPREAHARRGGDDRVRPALFYLQRHFREAVSLHDAAVCAGLSPNYFCAQFRACTGQSFVDYVNDLRCRYARRLLAARDSSITEICYRSGFRSFSSFSREFRRRYGASPTALLHAAPPPNEKNPDFF